MIPGARIESLFMPGPEGRLEALLKHPPEAAASSAGRGAAAIGAAVVCHPHPLFGGTMHNKVVHTAAEALAGHGLPVLRFNFRGVGRSAGRHDGGRGEQEDLRAALDLLVDRFPRRLFLLAGYSFGAFVALKVGCDDRRAAALLGIAAPLGLFPFGFLRECRAPLALIQGEADPLSPLGLALTLAAMLPAGARVLPVAGADHAFSGLLPALGARVEEALEQFEAALSQR